MLYSQTPRRGDGASSRVPNRMYTRLGSFHDYYVKEWKCKLEMWAHAYPPGALHTNGHIDSYHVVIKSLFFVTKFNVLPFPHQA